MTALRGQTVLNVDLMVLQSVKPAITSTNKTEKDLARSVQRVFSIVLSVKTHPRAPNVPMTTSILTTTSVLARVVEMRSMILDGASASVRLAGRPQPTGVKSVMKPLLTASGAR